MEDFNLDDARARCRNLFHDMVEFFFAEADRLLGEIRAAAAKGDAAGVARLAHRLKGSVAYLGAAPATETCGRLEELGRAGPSAEMVEAAGELDLRIERLKAALAPHRKPTA
ncbi:MAG: Hpt domain-containing protein [Thermoguttaceae bacterium]|jgi:protein-histidine pros-kinase